MTDPEFRLGGFAGSQNTMGCISFSYRRHMSEPATGSPSPYLTYLPRAVVARYSIARGRARRIERRRGVVVR